MDRKKRQKMKVVFIIPMYNAAPHVKELVDSLQSQTNPNWKAILIDDMSEDDTIFMVNHCTGNDKRFELIVNKEIKNLVDYMIGVEAGLDSNARKNRGGHAMEDIVEVFIQDLCKKDGIRYLKEANADKIRQEFGYDVPVDKSSRRYDFVIDNGKELFLIETNFYGGGGSKLKSTAGEYRNLSDVLDGKFKFFWITDGSGWKTTARPLRETFNHNDYVFSLSMLEQGILDQVI